MLAAFRNHDNIDWIPCWGHVIHNAIKKGPEVPKVLAMASIHLDPESSRPYR